ncbi:hypothetical protein BDV06DRAFT_219764 [Aspergillus oleicola]
MKLSLVITLASSFSGLASAAALTPHKDADITVTKTKVDANVDTTDDSTLSRRFRHWGSFAGHTIEDISNAGGLAELQAKLRAKAEAGGKARRFKDAEKEYQEGYQEEYDDSNYFVLTERDLEEQYYNATSLSERDLEARAPFDYNHIYCDVKWEETSLQQARARRKSLFPDEKGKPTLGPGPGKCSRVACAYNAAIVWCNDNKYTLNLASWQVVAHGADKIFNKCSKSHYGKGMSVHGQAFHAGNWNVIVRKEKC